MNNLIPMTPSRGEIQMMEQTRDILNSLEHPASHNNVGSYTGQRLYENTNHAQRNRPSPSPIYPTYIPDDPQQGVEAMKNIMESLNSVFGEENSYSKETYNTQQIKEKNSTYENMSDNWEVVVSLDETGSRIYTVKNESREIFEDMSFSLFESAYTISKILNKNGSTRRINDIIELDEDFKTYRSESILSKRNYNACIKLNESEAAVIHNTRYKQSQQKAVAIQESVKNILKSI